PRNLAEITNVQEQRKAAEARATELETAKVKAEAELQLDREKWRSAIIVEGKRGKAAMVVAVVGLVSAALGSVVTLLAKGDSSQKSGEKVAPRSSPSPPASAQPSDEAQKIAMMWRG